MGAKRHQHVWVSLILILAVVFAGCAEWQNPFIQHKKSRPVENLPPETYIFLFVDQDTVVKTDTVYTDAGPQIVRDTVIVGLDTTESRQIIHWWGDDPDGEVIGYYVQWEFDPEPKWTTQEVDTIYLPIRSRYDAFTLRVWAVDNDSLRDPTPAVLTFPVKNSPPHIEFRVNSNPPAPPGNPNVVAYTFPTRTFVWDVSDLDGRETVVKILWALDDTSSWNELPGSANSVTIRDIPPGSHRFFAKAVDIAGAESNTISFPDPNDEGTPNTWIVKEPVGEVLLVNDFAQDQTFYQVQKFYQKILDELIGPDQYSVWEIGTDRRPMINPQNRLPYSQVDIEATLAYFKKVIWFAHLGRPHISQAGLSITKFVSGGGKIFITNGNEGIPDTTWTFTRIDSVFRLNPGGRLLPGVHVLANFGDETLNQLLTLKIGQLVGNRVSALIPGPGAEVVYFMEPDTATSIPVPYKGAPPVGIRYRIGQGESIYFSLPLHYCNGLNNVKELLRYLLLEEFER
jgi:hypothetical protein